MKVAWAVSCAVVLAVSVPLSASGKVIYDNGAPDQGSHSLSDVGQGVEWQADDFLLTPEQSVITDIHWWGIYWNRLAGPGIDDFTMAILDTDLGTSLPGAVVYSHHAGAVSRVSTGLTDSNGFEIFSYSLDVDPIVLDGNRTYWLELYNNTDGRLWGWSTSNATGGEHACYYDGLGWDSTFMELAFNLTNDGNAVVPEPTSLALLGLGAAGLVVRRFRARR